MATGPTVTKPSANKCRSLCNLISNLMHVSLEQPNDGIAMKLTHRGRVTHICVGKLTIIGSDDGLVPGRHQTIIWTNYGILLIWSLGTNFSEILIGIETFSFKKMHLKMSSAKWRPFCLGLSVLTHWGRDEMNNISQTIFSNVCSSMKIFEFRSKFHWSLLPRVQLTIFQHWFR